MNRLAVRRRWFQVHRWIGLLLAAVIVPITLSGAALVWSDGLDRLIHPARHSTSGSVLLPLARYVAAVQPEVRDGVRIANLVLPAQHGPVLVTLTAPAALPDPRGRRLLIYLDPATARVLDVADGGTGVMRALHVLHGSLFVPGAGRLIVGWIGVALMVASLTGLWLWWPVTGRIARGLRWRRQPSLAANLHHMAGFWIALPLFLLALTGAWISFPAFFGALVGEPVQRRALAIAQRPVAQPALEIDDVVARGQPFAPSAPLRTIILPTEQQADWTLSYDTMPLRTVMVADDSGTAAPGRAFAAAGGVSFAQWARRLHDGTGMGLAWQALIFAAGLMPTLLAVTGVLMWWRRR
ncbi:PepSY-associated TM helix domain-containing protein [uncultured Sphingomonas sp.]|uniref:PepSY-associated TM helix domain-containing protein n=1 Tax=unclassified Sphingomonas TaxID=196159 RepID=UPI0025CEB14C|nr:PepSY-associated TM helix domain-containing protein [uncultured Sphingomonas sp.]